MKIESRKCINIRKIVEYLGTDVATTLLQIHAVTRLDTTSLLNFVGKIKVLKNFLNRKEKLRLLNTIDASCKVSERSVKDIEKLLKLFATLKKKKKVLTKTSVWLCKQTRTKTSQSLPPHKKSMVQATKLIFCEVYYWLRVDETIINGIFLQDHGLIVDNQNEEVWPFMVHWICFNFKFAFP